MDKKYEAIFIIKANEDDNKTKQIIDKINNMITSENCEIYYKDEKGMYDLTFEIKGEKKGFYYYINFKILDNKELEENNINIKINTIEEVLKHIIIKLEA